MQKYEMNEQFNCSGFTLVSSSEEKLAEFRSFGLKDLNIKRGVDLPEVDSDIITVITYKALSVPVNHIVEDTSLVVEGIDIGANVRWFVNRMHEEKDFIGRSAIWTTLLGVNTGEEIKIYRGDIEGVLVAPRGKRWGFDAIFQPNGVEYTLSELNVLGTKDLYSARRFAAEAFINNKTYLVRLISDIEPWSGSWQNNYK